MPDPNSPQSHETVEGMQKGVSCPQPSAEEENQTVKYLVEELNWTMNIMDQASQTELGARPSLLSEPSTNPFQSAMVFHSLTFCLLEFQDNSYLCPYRHVPLEERVSQKGWEYIKCSQSPR